MYSEDVQGSEDFEALTTRALERRPDAFVPAGFAARVRATLPPQSRRRAPQQLGQKTALAALVVLALTLFALAPHAAPSFGNLAFDLELLVIVQLGGISYWLTSRRGV